MEETRREELETRIPPHLDVEKATERAKMLKEDLDKGEGWTQRYRVENEYNSWSKTFPDDEVPVKILCRLENLPMSAEKFIEMMKPSNIELRTKWDQTSDLEILETFENGGCIERPVVQLAFPLCDRDYVLYMSPPLEIDWFGKKAFAIFFQNATHPSRPAGAHGIVRATNGGNFYISVPDEEEPENKCEGWILTTNTYNGWIPDKNEWLTAAKATKVFGKLRDYIVEGYKNYFS